MSQCETATMWQLTSWFSLICFDIFRLKDEE